MIGKLANIVNVMLVSPTNTLNQVVARKVVSSDELPMMEVAGVIEKLSNNLSPPSLRSGGNAGTVDTRALPTWAAGGK